MEARSAHGSGRVWPTHKKSPARGRLIAFIDESGLSERPTRVRTWAPVGQTPVIQFHFNWKHLSVIAGLTCANCVFRFHEGSIKRNRSWDFSRRSKPISSDRC